LQKAHGATGHKVFFIKQGDRAYAPSTGRNMGGELRPAAGGRKGPQTSCVAPTQRGEQEIEGKKKFRRKKGRVARVARTGRAGALKRPDSGLHGLSYGKRKRLPGSTKKGPANRGPQTEVSSNFRQYVSKKEKPPRR